MKRYIHSSKEISFRVAEGLGLNSPVLKLSNGDEIKLDRMSYVDRGDNRKDYTPESEDIDEHFTDEFILNGVGGRKYRVTREVTLYNRNASVKGGRFKSKIVKVEEI